MSFLRVSMEISVSLCAWYVHVFDSLRLNKWYKIKLCEGYFVAKYKKFPEGIAFCISFANGTTSYTYVWTNYLRAMKSCGK